ncbi:MAG: hypothetical protein ACYTGP_06595 [Planctomycetota bacterium]|jgi:hypothetical protein
MHARSVAILIGLGAVLTACTSHRAYEGPPQETESVLETMLDTEYETLLEFDREELPFRCWKVYHLPGHHSVKARIQWVNGYIEEVTLGFESKPQRTYRLSTSTAPIGNYTSSMDWLVPALTMGQAAMPPNRRRYSVAPLGRPRHGYCTIWIHDVDSREVVGGVAPSSWYEETERRREQRAESEQRNEAYIAKKEWGP